MSEKCTQDSDKITMVNALCTWTVNRSYEQDGDTVIEFCNGKKYVVVATDTVYLKPFRTREDFITLYRSLHAKILKELYDANWPRSKRLVNHEINKLLQEKIVEPYVLGPEVVQAQIFTHANGNIILQVDRFKDVAKSDFVTYTLTDCTIDRCP